MASRSIISKSPGAPAPSGELAAIRQELASLRHAVEELLAEIRTPAPKSGRALRAQRRHERLRRIAAATGLQGWAAASELQLILCGKAPIPAGVERDVEALARDPEAARSLAHLHRVLSVRVLRPDTSLPKLKRTG